MPHLRHYRNDIKLTSDPFRADCTLLVIHLFGADKDIDMKYFQLGRSDKFCLFQLWMVSSFDVLLEFSGSVEAMIDILRGNLNYARTNFLPRAILLEEDVTPLW